MEHKLDALQNVVGQFFPSRYWRFEGWETNFVSH